MLRGPWQQHRFSPPNQQMSPQIPPGAKLNPPVRYRSLALKFISASRRSGRMTRKRSNPPNLCHFLIPRLLCASPVSQHLPPANRWGATRRFRRAPAREHQVPLLSGWALKGSSSALNTRKLVVNVALTTMLCLSAIVCITWRTITRIALNCS